MSDTKLLQDLEQSQKVKLDTSAEAKAMLAFELKVLQLLHKDSSVATKKSKSHLKQFPSYKDWWDNGTGLKDCLSDALPSVEHGFLSQIEDCLIAALSAHSAATIAVLQTMAWIGAPYLIHWWNLWVLDLLPM